MKKYMNYRRLTTRAAVLSVAVVLCACGGPSAQEGAAVRDEAIKVKTERVYLQAVPQTYEFTATVEANAVNRIAPQQGGRIDRIYVEVGDRVAAGTKLVQMEEASLKQSRAQLDNLETSFARIDELYKIGGISKSDWDAQKTALEVARTAYQNLSSNTQLLSPISGIVTARNYDSGDLYGGSPILEVQQISPVKLLINISERYYTAVSKGMTVSVRVDVYGDEEFEGKVSLIYPTIDGQTHTFPVEVVIPNRDLRIRPGMYARVTVNFGDEQYVVIPDQAVVRQSGSGDRFVYVYNADGTVSMNRVVLGRRLDNAYEVLSGVPDDAQVVVAGQSKLTNGSKVEIVK